MRPSAKRALLAVALIAAVTALTLVVALINRPKQAPSLTLTLIDGQRWSFAAARGRPVLVTFWATSCPPCVREAPSLAALQRALAPRGFELVAIAMPYDPPVNVLAFTREYRLPYRVALDLKGEAAAAFKVNAIPQAYLIDRDGSIVWRHTGMLDTAAVRQKIERLLE